MESVQKKSILKTCYCFLMFLALRVIEELLIAPKVGINTKGFISCLGGLVLLMIFIRIDNKPLDGIGVLFSRHKIVKGFLIALAMNAGVAVAVFAAEYFQFSTFEGTPRLTLYYDKVSNAFSFGVRNFLLMSGFCLLVAVIHALFYETAFRGLLFTLASRGLHFKQANLLQAGLYSIWYLVPVLRVAVYNDGNSAKQIVITLLFAVVYEFITALKLGLLRKSTGAVWVCIFDHIMFSFILDMVHLQFTNPNMSVSTDANYYVRLLAYQGIALLVSVIYNQSKSKKIYHKQTAQILEQSAQG